MQAVRSNAKEGATPLARFRRSLERDTLISDLRDDLIGETARIEGPYGVRNMVYADYVASGRALGTIECFILDEVLPYYANSHTEASYCGGFMTRMRREARALIAECCGAGEKYAVIFTGSGATSGINRLVRLFGVAEAVRAGKKVRIVTGPYEHHSNILPWRETGAEIVELAEAPDGGPDMAHLDAVLHRGSPDLTICTFSAASNITGITCDVAAVTRMVKAAGATMIWDYAGGGPYLPIAMSPDGSADIDAVVVSPHKFIGGPGASGILIVRRQGLATGKPSWPGGGMVKFVSPEAHDYSENLEAREEAGTPNVVGDIRAALVFAVKHAIGVKEIERRNRALTAQVFAAWKDVPRLEVLGLPDAGRLPIFSFRVRDGSGGYVHQQLVTRMLSDRFGIQARGGCACAGPYVHRLLAIDARQSQEIRQAILAGDELRKPGFTRLNFCVLLPDEKVQFIIDSVARLAADAPAYAADYDCDPSRAIFFPKAAAAKEPVHEQA